jgi:hypothetical protein
MKGIDISFARHSVPTPGAIWLNLNETERMAAIHSSLDALDPAWSTTLGLVSARNDGFVTFEFKSSIPANVRGSYLLNLEGHLKQNVDPSLTLWIAPVGDKSSLRNLRGIEVKK